MVPPYKTPYMSQPPLTHLNAFATAVAFSAPPIPHLRTTALTKHFFTKNTSPNVPLKSCQIYHTSGDNFGSKLLRKKINIFTHKKNPIDLADV